MAERLTCKHEMINCVREGHQNQSLAGFSAQESFSSVLDLRPSWRWLEMEAA
jgi:hypothetical protein